MESNEDIYYQQLIYNLIVNRNIYSFSNDEKRTNDYYLDLNNYNNIDIDDDDNIPWDITFFQKTILSLKDFTRCSSLIIKKSAENQNSDNYKEKFFYNYSKYLRIIKSICSYFINHTKNPL